LSTKLFSRDINWNAKLKA